MTMGLVRAFLICAAFGLFTGKAHGSGSSVHVLAKIPGQSVLFNTSWDPVVPYTYLTWERMGFPIPIVTVNGSVINILSIYKDRVTVFDDGSLELRNLTLSDSREYRVNITSTEATGVSSLYELYVQKPVSDVRISTDAIDVVEGYPVSFKCSASGSSLKYKFYYRNQTITSFLDEAELRNLNRNDIGPYRCEAYNLINRVTSSNEINLTINYGPDDVIMKVFPLQDVYSDGSKVTLQCTVIGSKPEAEISWWFDYPPVQLPFNGPEIQLGPLKYEDHGSYECRATNRRTNFDRTRSFYLRVEYVPPQSLSDGAIVGIAIACIAVVFGSGAIVFYLMNRKN